MRRALVIAVIGAGDAPPPEVLELAFEVGRRVAAHGMTLVCGGLGGVMQEAARGAREAGGHTIGILPGDDASEANPWIEFALATGVGEARNAAVVGSADGVIALAGEGGTLAEIGFAWKLERPLVALRSWSELPFVHHLEDPSEAVEWLLKRIGRPSSPDG